MTTIATKLPYIGWIETKCLGEPVRCIAAAILGHVRGRYAFFRPLRQFAGLWVAGHNLKWVKRDLNSAYVYALRLAANGRVCLDDQGRPWDCEIKHGRQWEGWVEFERWAYLRSLAEEVDRNAYTVIVGADRSEWAVYWQPGQGGRHCRKVADTYGSLAAAVTALRRSRCKGVVIRTRDMLKYGVLTNIGYTYWTGDAWIFDLAVSLTTTTLMAAIEAAKTVVYVAYIDTIVARDDVDMIWQSKVEDEVEDGLIVLPVTYRGRNRHGYWGIGNCDAFERDEVRRPWDYVDLVLADPEWLYAWARDVLRGRIRPRCWKWVNMVKEMAARAGIEGRPTAAKVRDVRHGQLRLWDASVFGNIKA